LTRSLFARAVRADHRLDRPRVQRVEDAIQNAVSRASKTIRGMKWFEVSQTRGHIENGSVRHYQVTLRAGFTIED
jgi:flavin-binding protein dodecin